MRAAGNDERWKPWFPPYTRAPRRPSSGNTHPRRPSPGRTLWAPSALRKRDAGGPAPRQHGDAGAPKRKAPENKKTGVARNRQTLRAVALEAQRPPKEGRCGPSTLRKRGAGGPEPEAHGDAESPAPPERGALGAQRPRKKGRWGPSARTKQGRWRHRASRQGGRWGPRAPPKGEHWGPSAPPKKWSLRPSVLLFP